MLKKVRLISQTAFFVLFCLTVFFLMAPPAAYNAPAWWILRLNPLIALLTSIAARGVFVPLLALGLLTAVLTVIFGRFFCGMVCPLGSMIDFTDRYLMKAMRIRKARPPLFVQKIKYVILIACAVMAVFGSMAPFFIDPILLLTRAFALVVNPFFAVAAEDLRDVAAPLLTAAGFDHLSYVVVKIPLYYGSAAAFALCAVIIGAGMFDRRFWCQYICPSGALFGLLSRYAVFRRRAHTQACNSCKACSAGCPVRAIDEDGKRTSVAECVLCGFCTNRKKSCNSFGFALPASAEVRGADIQRRHVVAGIAGGIFLAPAIRANAASRHSGTGRVIRPPGAVPESEFLARCISCGACMKACPTNAIQPCMPGDGFQRLYTPKIVPRTGGCEEKCFVCGHVCPTGAIRKLSYDEKRFVKIGTAVIDRHRCLAWEQNKECLVCDEVCPYNAITAMIVETTTGAFKVPVVDEDMCLGCGMCEQHCPITDQAAIIVYRFGENRRSSGKYVTDMDKEEILKKRLISDKDIGASLSEAVPEGMAGDLAPPLPERPSDGTAESSGLPPGFVE